MKRNGTLPNPPKAAVVKKGSLEVALKEDDLSFSFPTINTALGTESNIETNLIKMCKKVTFLQATCGAQQLTTIREVKTPFFEWFVLDVVFDVVLEKHSHFELAVFDLRKC